LNTTNLHKQTSAISPIIATLLLILIAIAAGVIVYAYVVGFIGSSTSNSGGSTATLSIDQLTMSSKTASFPVTAYVRNEGPTSEAFNTGFYVKGSSLNTALDPAISVSVASGTLTIVSLSTISLAYLSATSVTVSIGGLSCSTAVTATVSAFGVSGTATCSSTPTTQTATLLGLGATVSSTFAASTSTSITTVSSVVIGVPVTIGTLTVSLNNVFDFTLAPAGAQASNILSSGSTYTFQAIGTDGGSAALSAKAS
jgi:hypothetical protein